MVNIVLNEWTILIISRIELLEYIVITVTLYKGALIEIINETELFKAFYIHMYILKNIVFILFIKHFDKSKFKHFSKFYDYRFV